MIEKYPRFRSVIVHEGKKKSWKEVPTNAEDHLKEHEIDCEEHEKDAKLQEYISKRLGSGFEDGKARWEMILFTYTGMIHLYIYIFIYL